MTTLLVGSLPAVDRLLERGLGAGSVSAASLASAADEAQLERFPPPAWCASQEANVFVLDRLRDARWRWQIASAARAEGVDPDTLERLLSQIFVLGWGRRLGVIRLCVAVMDAPRIRLASDLPPALRDVFLREFDGRVVPARFLSGLLRLIRAAQDVGGGLARHVVRLARLARLAALPTPPARRASYVAWLGAAASDVANAGPDRMSLTEFLAEARAGTGIDQVVIQGPRRPASLPEGVLHRATVPPLRYRPSWRALAGALLGQARLALHDLSGALDFRRRTLIGRALIDLPACRLWLSADRPAAVLYSNATIGLEPPVALLGSRYGVPSTMVFYSANVAYRHPPARFTGPPTRLEPEQRFIVADRLTMWTETMTRAFAGAGYPPTRLVETGPIVFARQRGFRPTSRVVSGGRGPIRIGVFDVSVLRPSRRFELGEGRLIYNPDYAAGFFRDTFVAARRTFGEDFVIVRKLKRSLHPFHAEDVDFTRFPAVKFESRDPAESLWRVLEAVDIVLCMPFTSVAYLADAFGIPAAYYDPSGTVTLSPLGGRAALLSGPRALEAWLDAPTCWAGRDPNDLIGPTLLAAATGVSPSPDNHHPLRLETHVLDT